MEKKYILMAGNICYYLMRIQVATIEDIWEHSHISHPDIKREEFDEIILLLEKSHAITGIRKSYAYQTNFVMQKYKSMNSVTSFLQRKCF